MTRRKGDGSAWGPHQAGSTTSPSHPKAPSHLRGPKEPRWGPVQEWAQNPLSTLPSWTGLALPRGCPRAAQRGWHFPSEADNTLALTWPSARTATHPKLTPLLRGAKEEESSTEEQMVLSGGRIREAPGATAAQTARSRAPPPPAWAHLDVTIVGSPVAVHALHRGRLPLHQVDPKQGLEPHRVIHVGVMGRQVHPANDEKAVHLRAGSHGGGAEAERPRPQLTARTTRGPTQRSRASTR